MSTHSTTPKRQPTTPDDSTTTHHHAPEFKSIGYHVHNELTYRGVDWLLNSVIGVGFTYATNRTEIGKNLFSRPVGKAFETLLTPVLKQEHLIQSGSKWGTMLTGILVGGTAITPVMTALENKENKKAFIHRVDTMVYGKEAVEREARFKEQDAHIDHESTKDMKTGLITRYVALAPIIAATVYPHTNDQLIKYLYQPIGNATKAVSEGTKLVPRHTIARMMQKGEHEATKHGSKFVSNWDFAHRTIGFDFGLTFIYSFLHEITYKALANHNEGKAEEKNSEQPYIAKNSKETQTSAELPSASVQLSTIMQHQQQGQSVSGYMRGQA